MNLQSLRIVFIEDEVLISLALRAQIRNKFGDSISYSVSKNFLNAEKIISDIYNKFDKIILFSDYNLGKENANFFLTKINIYFPDIYKFVISSHDNLNDLIDTANIIKIIKKPWNEKEIIEIIENIINEVSSK
jgi:hypothetical protein